MSDKVNRRRFLRSSAGAIATISALSSNVTGQISKSESYTITLTGDLHNPLSLREIKPARRELKKRFKQENPTTDVGTFSGPKLNEQYSLVAYTLVIDKSGHTNQFYGTIKRHPSEDIHSFSETNTCSERDELVGLAKRYQSIQTGRIGAQSVDRFAAPGYNTVNNSVGDELTAEDGFTHIASNKPWGKLGMYADIWSEPDPSDHWVVRQDLRIVPGVNVPDWDRFNQGKIGNGDAPDLSARHQWTYIHSVDGTVKSNTPNGPNPGKSVINASLGTGGAQVGYSYTVPNISREDNSNFQNAKWNWNWNSGPGGTWRLKTGSRAKFPYSNRTDDFHVNLEGTVRFWRDDGWFSTGHDMIGYQNQVALK